MGICLPAENKETKPRADVPDLDFQMYLSYTREGTEGGRKDG